jgi:membrane fusion protein (multidrug efflux system)
MQKKIKQFTYIFHLPVFIIAATFILYACKSSTNNGYGAPPPEALPVIIVRSMPATTYQEYTASLEGSRDIEIRPQVDGYLDKIYIDEGQGFEPQA